MRSFLLLLVLLCVTSSQLVLGDLGRCRALAMSGGGDKAAYEAGVIRGLVEYLPAEEVTYDVVTGISAGSTLTAAFSVFPLGMEPEVAKFALNIISDLNQSSIFTMWPGGIVEGLMNHSSLLDSRPLRNLFQTQLAGYQPSPDRVTCMGMSNLNTGLFERKCNQTSIAAIVDHTIASAAIPGVFLSQTIDGSTYVDGGVLVNVDVIGAIEQCIGLGYAEEDIIVDVIECSGVNITAMPGDLSNLTVLPILLRSLPMREFAGSERDYAAAMHAYPSVNFRYRIHPTEPIPGSGIDFNRTEMFWMTELGTSDARDAIRAKESESQPEEALAYQTLVSDINDRE